jgi:exosome complex component RRP41
VALADAGIPMKDVVCGVAAGKIDGQVAVDFGKAEDNYGESDIPIAVSMRSGELLLLQMDGLLSKQEVLDAIDLAMKSCSKVHELQVAALKERYAEKERSGEAPQEPPKGGNGGEGGKPLSFAPGSAVEAIDNSACACD